MPTTSYCRKFTYNIINTQLWERESARALQTIRTVGFLQKLSTIDDVTKYRSIFETVYYRRVFPIYICIYYRASLGRGIIMLVFLIF